MIEVGQIVEKLTRNFDCLGIEDLFRSNANFYGVRLSAEMAKKLEFIVCQCKPNAQDKHFEWFSNTVGTLLHAVLLLLSTLIRGKDPGYLKAVLLLIVRRPAIIGFSVLLGISDSFSSYIFIFVASFSVCSTSVWKKFLFSSFVVLTGLVSVLKPYDMCCTSSNLTCRLMFLKLVAISCIICWQVFHRMWVPSLNSKTFGRFSP